jgi:PAS domain S-box-containing protein
MRLLAEGGVESLSAERLYRHADGRDIWMRIQATGLPDESGRVTTVLAQLEDVTASRAVARELAQQARLLELIPAAVIVRGVDGGIRWFNAAATELYGWPHDVAAGKTSHKLLATTFPDGLTAAAQDQAILDTGGWTGELQHLSATGRRLTVLSRQVLQPGYDGEPDLILEINTDVTERRAAEQALAESEQRFRGQFQHSAIGQIVRSLDGRLLDVNPAFAAMLGLDREAVIGTSWLDWLDAPSAALSMAEQALLYTGERDAYQAEKGLVCPDGRHLEVHATVSLVRDAEGRPNHIIGVLADITARKAAERERDAAATELARRNEELEAANQLKLDLIGMLGHEIGTPLSVIHGYSELGADEDGPAADHTASRALFATIERNARRLDQVVGEVLALVSVDAGKLVATPRTVRIADHLRTACDTASCAPAVEGDPELTARVQAGHLDQILVNLLTNAHKYGGGCTRVVVARGADETVTVAVHDEGPGVPEDFRDRLFERFSRAADTAGVRKGTGLGLYIVQQLARANRGDVTYSPGAGGGSVFTVRLAA